MRSNVIYSVSAAFAVFTLFAAVFVAFALPVPATADQPAGPTAAVSATQEQSVREIPEVIVESRRAI